MNTKHKLSTVLLSVLSMTFFSPALAADNTVHLRTSCTENGQPIENCFTDTESAIDWLKNKSQSAGSKTALEIALEAALVGETEESVINYINDLLAAEAATKPRNKMTLRVGPGDFSSSDFGLADVTFLKDDISIIGSGQETTTIGRMLLNNAHLHIQDLSVDARQQQAAVFWNGPRGSSTWTNVHLKNGDFYGWSESCVGIIPETRPVHRWFSSTIESGKKTAYVAGCSENWFFGSELVTSIDSSFVFDTPLIPTVLLIGNTGNTANTGLNIAKPEVHIYGSVLRILTAPGLTIDSIAVRSDRDAEVHIHGTGIDVIGNELPNTITALSVNKGGFIHASQSSYVMKTGAGGKARRIANDGTGTVKAPYQWEPILGDNPSIDLKSQDGADSTMEMVACSEVDCIGEHPHLMVYSEDCGTENPWFDTVTGQCRL